MKNIDVNIFDFSIVMSKNNTPTIKAINNYFNDLKQVLESYNRAETIYINKMVELAGNYNFHVLKANSFHTIGEKIERQAQEKSNDADYRQFAHNNGSCGRWTKDEFSNDIADNECYQDIDRLRSEASELFYEASIKHSTDEQNHITEANAKFDQIISVIDNYRNSLVSLKMPVYSFPSETITEILYWSGPISNFLNSNLNASNLYNISKVEYEEIVTLNSNDYSGCCYLYKTNSNTDFNKAVQEIRKNFFESVKVSLKDIKEIIKEYMKAVISVERATVANLNVKTGEVNYITSNISYNDSTVDLSSGYNGSFIGSSYTGDIPVSEVSIIDNSNSRIAFFNKEGNSLIVDVDENGNVIGGIDIRIKIKDFFNLKDEEFNEIEVLNKNFLILLAESKEYYYKKEGNSDNMYIHNEIVEFTNADGTNKITINAGGLPDESFKNLTISKLGNHEIKSIYKYTRRQKDDGSFEYFVVNPYYEEEDNSYPVLDEETYKKYSSALSGDIDSIYKIMLEEGYSVKKNFGSKETNDYSNFYPEYPNNNSQNDDSYINNTNTDADDNSNEQQVYYFDSATDTRPNPYDGNAGEIIDGIYFAPEAIEEMKKAHWENGNNPFATKK